MSQYEQEDSRARARPFQHGNGQHPILWQPLIFCLFVGDEDHNNSAARSRHLHGLVHIARIHIS